MNLLFLPSFNAICNSLAFLCLIAGWLAIKNKHKRLHIKFMASAFFFSTIFLVSYLYYHSQVGSKRFPDLGWIKTLYLAILIPHTFLAAVMVPMILKTFYHALRSEWDKHRKIALITLPVWLFVSFTGVIIYFMLYHWFAI